jgi:NAD(P)-dependent dehydrogenase (short-subunit alcohol dehydrogenase family)
MINNFGGQTSCDQVLANTDLSGKTVVITGGSGGLGAEVARAMAAKGARVILASRDGVKTRARAAEINRLLESDVVSAFELDLADLHSVRRAAHAIVEHCAQIDVLINNAGLMASPLARTAQGFEMQFGVNHLGHFLLTKLLMPQLRAAGNQAGEARVVVLSSAGHKHSNIDFDDLNWHNRDYDKWAAYGAAKTANALFAVALNQRFQSQGITANAVHPGAIVTDLGRHLNSEDMAFIMGRADKLDDDTAPRTQLVMKSIEAGAATSVWAASSPELKGKGGLYLEDCQIAGQVEEGFQPSGYYAYALDTENAERLWEMSEAFVLDKTVVLDKT